MNIPKSLHTVTVLVAVAKLIRDKQYPFMAPSALVDMAADQLGYGITTDDQYGLLAKATAILSRSVQS